MIDEQLIQFYLTVSAARRRRFFCILDPLYRFSFVFKNDFEVILESPKSPECLSKPGDHIFQVVHRFDLPEKTGGP